MSRSPNTAAPVLPLFEINLIEEQAKRLHRRRRMERIGSVATIVLLALAGALLVFSLHNLLRVARKRIGLKALTVQLKELKQECADLDAKHASLSRKTAGLAPLLPLCRKRVAWAPKLAALGAALPRGMAIHKLDANAGDLFYAPPPLAKKRRAAAPPLVRKLSFSLIYLPAAGETQDPIGLLLERLRGSEAFMDKMDFTRLEAAEKGVWDGLSVIFFRGLLRGESAAQ